MLNKKNMETEIAPKTVKSANAKRVNKIGDSALVNVQSNVYGELIYVDVKTGDTIIWNEFGDIQTMTMGMLRSMRGTQRAFFENNWVFIHEVIDEDYEDVTPLDVYKTLMVTQYYKDALEPDNFYHIFQLDYDELEAAVARLSAAGRTNLIVAANEAIKSGVLDSYRKIRLLEELLGCELVEMP